MTRLCTIIAALTLSIQCIAGTPYFCNRAGSELEYRRTKADSGKTVWVHRLSILSEDNGKYGCRSVISSAKGKALAEVDFITVIDEEGNVSSDLSSTLGSAIASIMPNAKIESNFSPALLPNEMKEGEHLPDAAAKLKVNRLTFTTSVSERKVLRKETLQTPAGTFDCIVITEKKAEKYSAYKRNTVSYTWYAKGIGMVRHDTWKNGSPETSELLISIKN